MDDRRCARWAMHLRVGPMALILGGCPGPPPSYTSDVGVGGMGGGVSESSGSGATGGGATTGAATTGGGSGGGCPDDTFGTDCAPCPCQNGATCDEGESGSGACTCASGTYGLHCSQHCECGGVACDDGVAGDGACYPSRCADVLAIDPSAADGEYVVYHEADPAKPWTTYCHDFDGGAPVEFLSLLTPNEFIDNSGSFIPPGAPVDPAKITSFTRIRLDPSSLTVNVTDLTFADLSGDLSPNDGSVDDRAYATVGSCKANHTLGAQGTGAVDLRGTPFRVNDAFDNFGYLSFGNLATEVIAVVSAEGQVVDLTGDGQCGYTGPLARAAFFGDTGWANYFPEEAPDPTQDPVWSLRLAFVP